MRDQFISTLCTAAAENRRVMLLTGDLGFSVLDEYRRRFPQQFINLGVAEQNMALVATGMALEGFIVFTYSIANFPTLRSLEMLRNAVAYHGANVKIVSVGSGFSYGPLGISHHATEDIAIMRSIPDIVCLSPSSVFEVEEATRSAVNIQGPVFLRLDKDIGPDGPIDEPFYVGVPRKIKTGKDVAIFTTGGILSEALEASTILNDRGISCSIYSVPTLKPLHPEKIILAARSHKEIITLEEHTTHGGLGSIILEVLNDNQARPTKILRLGLNGCFSSIVGSQKHLRAIYGLDGKSVARRIEEHINRPQ